MFATASVLCGVAGSPELLIGARFLQGLGGALASAVSLGMIVTLFTDPREQGRAIGAFSFVGAAGASVGLVLADGYRLAFGLGAGLLAVALVLTLVVLRPRTERLTGPVPEPVSVH